MVDDCLCETPAGAWACPIHEGDVLREARRRADEARAVSQRDPDDVDKRLAALDAEADLAALRRGDTLTGAGRPTSEPFTGDGREP